MRKCPRTGETLKKINADGVELDVSEHCGGIWFDRFELRKFEQPQSEAGHHLVEHIRKFSIRIAPKTAALRLHCPIDHDVVMMRRFYSPKMQIQIDECPACGGVWLDPGELEQIINLFHDSADFKAVSNRFANEVINGTEMQEYLARSDASLEKIQNIVNVMSNVAKSFWLGHNDKEIKKKLEDSVK